MARKFGKKNEVKIDPLKYNICLLGEPKFVKQHLLKKYAKNWLGKTVISFLK